MSAQLRVSELCSSPACVPPPPDLGDAPAVPGIGAQRLSRCALATGTPTHEALSVGGHNHLPRARLAACVLRDVCGTGVRPRRLRSVQTTRTYSRAKGAEAIPGGLRSPCGGHSFPSPGGSR